MSCLRLGWFLLDSVWIALLWFDSGGLLCYWCCLPSFGVVLWCVLFLGLLPGFDLDFAGSFVWWVFRVLIAVLLVCLDLGFELVVVGLGLLRVCG